MNEINTTYFQLLTDLSQKGCTNPTLEPCSLCRFYDMCKILTEKVKDKIHRRRNTNDGAMEIFFPSRLIKKLAKEKIYYLIDGDRSEV